MGKRVLIVDDAAFMRMMIRDILVANKYEIAGEAEDGAEAIIVFKRTKPDLVLMDITMPDMNGIRAVEEIIKIDPAARIVMISAMGQQSMVIRSIKAGALDFVVKPFHNDRVMEAIDRVFALPRPT